MSVAHIRNRVVTPLGIILLRNWHLRDDHSLQQNANSYSVWKNVGEPFPHPYTIDHAQEFINGAFNSRIEKIFAIDFNNEAIGSCGIKIKSGMYKGNAEIGLWIGERYWNKGIGTHVIKFLTGTAFDELKVRRVYAKVFKHNLACARILEKNGFKHEATFKCGVLKNERYIDELVFAKLNPNLDLV